MTIIVTGAAGFIGANLVKALNGRGITDIVAVDNLLRAEKFSNLVDCEIADYFDKHDFLARLNDGYFENEIEAIFHQGACSNTMEQDGRYMMENNYRYSLALLNASLEEEIPFIYASSAAIYGGNQGFSESRANEGPLNIYGYSKFLFDQVVRRQLREANSQIVGFRYFNVYGPRESHKGRMASVAFHHYNQLKTNGCVRLFDGSHGYGPGEQRRDFVYIDDIIEAILFFYDHPDRSGIFNLGTGRAQSFNDVAASMVNSVRAASGERELPLQALQNAGLIQYIPFPEDLKGRYQAFTQADLTLLRKAGYEAGFLGVEEGVRRYASWLMEKIA